MPYQGDFNEHLQHVFMEKQAKLSLNYHQILPLSVPLKTGTHTLGIAAHRGRPLTHVLYIFISDVNIHAKKRTPSPDNTKGITIAAARYSSEDAATLVNYTIAIVEYTRRCGPLKTALERMHELEREIEENERLQKEKEKEVEIKKKYIFFFSFLLLAKFSCM